MRIEATAFRLAGVCALAAAPLLCADEARAADDHPLPRFMRLEYLRPAGRSCPGPEELEDLVLINAHRDPFNPSAVALLHVAIARRGALYVAEAELRDAAGLVVWSKPLDPRRSCDSLAQDLGFVIGDRLRDATPAPPPPPVDPPSPASLPPPDPTPPPAPPAASAHVNLGLGGALALRTAPQVVAFNLAAYGGFRLGSLSTLGELRLTLPEVAALDTTGHRFVSIMQLAGGLVPCGHYRALLFCGVGQVIAVLTQGEASSLVPSSPGTKVGGAAGVRLAGDIPLGLWKARFALRLSADALVTTRDVVIRYLDAPPPNTGSTGVAWSLPRVTVTLGVGFIADLFLK